MKSIIDTLSVIRNAVTQFEQEINSTASVALVGGHAVIFFGIERTTLDIDICFHSPTKEPGSTFYNFLKNHLPARFQIRFMEASKDPEDPLMHDLIVIDDSQEEYPRIDILMLRYKWELEGMEQAKSIAKLAFPIMPLPYLLAMKLMAGGRKDDLDIIELLKGMSEDDLEKTRGLAKKIGRERKLKTLLKEVKK